MIRRFLGIALIIVLVLIGICYYLSTIVQPPPTGASIPPDVQKQALDRINNAVNHPEPVGPQPTPTATPSLPKGPSKPAPLPKGVIQVKFAEDDVNTMLETNKDVQAKMQRVGATAAKLKFSPPNNIEVTAWITVQNVERQVTLSGTLSPDGNGGMVFHTDASKIGELPLPAGVTADKIDRAAGKVIDMVMPVLPLSVNTITVDGPTIVLTGPSKPTSVPN